MCNQGWRIFFLFFATGLVDCFHTALPCKKRCPLSYSPVCDTMGQSHSNQCEFENKKCDNALLDIKHNGPCLAVQPIPARQLYTCHHWQPSSSTLRHINVRAEKKRCEMLGYRFSHGNNGMVHLGCRPGCWCCKPLNGNAFWGGWGVWSTCSKSCGNGSKVRKRQCNNPVLRSGGRLCVGQSTQVASCKAKECTGQQTFKVKCEKDNMTAIWEKTMFPDLPLDISFKDSTCGHHYGNSTHVWITTGYNSCNTVTKQRSDILYHDNIAVVLARDSNGLIERKEKHLYHIRCILDRRIDVYTGNGFIATETVYEKSKNASVEFDATIAMYTSSSFLQALTKQPVSVTTFQPMYIGIRSDDKTKGLKFVVEECHASPSSNNLDNVKYVFFHMKCPVDATFKVLSNGDHHFFFTLEAFNFIKIRKSIRIHCQLLVCKSDSTSEECQQECIHGRKRREVRYDIDNAPLEKMAVISEEIQYKRKSTCQTKSCPQHSFCLDLYPAECRCNERFVKDRHTGLCRRDHVFKVQAINIEMTFLPTYDNTLSTDFFHLVTFLQQRFLADVPFGREVQGVKIVSVRKGGVIVDVDVLYANDTTKENAFIKVRQSIITYAKYRTSSSTDALIIKKDTVPKFFDYVKEKIEKDQNAEIEAQGEGNTSEIKKEEMLIDNTDLVAAVLVPVIVLIVGIIGLIFWYKHKHKVPHLSSRKIGTVNQGLDKDEVVSKEKAVQK